MPYVIELKFMILVQILNIALHYDVAWPLWPAHHSDGCSNCCQ